MSIQFNNADLLSYDHINNFFNDGNIRFKTTKNISVKGNLLNLYATSGISGIISGINALEQSANDWQSFIINGYNYGSGIITNISFDEMVDLRKERYTVNIQIFESGNITNLPTSGVFQGIDYSNYNLINNLTEKISYNNNFETKVYSHQIDVETITKNKNESINLGKNIAENLFKADNIINVLGQYNTLSGKKFLYSENYDEINGTCSYNREITLYSQNSGSYTINKTYNFTRDEDGTITVSERGDILALEEPYIDILSSGYLENCNFAYNNCLDVYNAYKTGNNYDLKDTPIIKGTSLNRFEKKMSYEFSYTNNLNVNSGFFWNYNHESSLGDRGIVESKENGEVIGFGHIVEEKYSASKSGYNSIKPLIYNRTKESFDRFITFNSSFDNSYFYLINTSESFAPYLGKISYNYTYNNDRTMLSGVNNLTKAKITVSEGYRIPITQIYNIFNFGEIEQVSAADTVSEKTVSVAINGKRDAVLDDYLQYFLSILPSYKEDFLISVDYSYNPYENLFNGNVTWGVIYE